MVEAVGRGMYRVTDGERQRIAYAAGPVEARWVFLDGRSYLVDLSAGPGRPRSGRQDADVLSAPMPATVVAINVAPGQRVAAGDVLIMLEAMKMELPIRAPREATVIAIGCRAGDLVQPGVSLLELSA